MFALVHRFSIFRYAPAQAGLPCVRPSRARSLEKLLTVSHSRRSARGAAADRLRRLRGLRAHAVDNDPRQPEGQTHACVSLRDSLKCEQRSKLTPDLECSGMHTSGCKRLHHLTHARCRGLVARVCLFFVCYDWRQYHGISSRVTGVSVIHTFHRGEFGCQRQPDKSE